MASKILLHICCAPCSIYPLQRFGEQGHGVTGLFFNPNIHPFAEYTARKQVVVDYAAAAKIEIYFPEYRPEEFFRAVSMLEERPERCPVCWSQRLRMTAQAAAENGFTHFSTTLLVSPYQDHDVLRQIGDQIAAEEGAQFYYEDFRPGYRAAYDKAKALGMYRQKYCGCIYSELERHKQR